MMLCNRYNWAAAALILLAMTGCGGPGTDQATTTADTLTVTQDADALVKVGNKLFSIPSPVQSVLLIRDLKAPYTPELALPTDSMARFTTKEKQAMALGIYGADLAYAAVHKDAQRALKTMKAVEQLSGQLNLANALSKGLLEGFKKNINNEDSLLRMTGTAFRNLDMYLKEDERNDVSVAVLTGGWVEGLYLALGATGNTLDDRLAKRIAEQQHTLNNLIELQQQNGGSPEVIALFQDLASSYKDISLEYTFVQPTLDAEHKITYINSETKAQVSPQALEGIVRKIRSIRSAIIT